MGSDRQVGNKRQDFYRDAVTCFEALVGKLTNDEHADATFESIETLIQTDGMEVLRQLTQAHLNQRQAEEELVKGVIGDDGQARTHRRPESTRQLESIFGEVEVNRCGYRGPGLNAVYPLDAKLNLPNDKYSPVLRRAIAHLLAGQSFDDTVEELQRRGGGRMPKRQMQEVAAKLIVDYPAYYAQPLAACLTRREEEVLVITVDGKGIAMHTQDLREATRKAAEAEQAEGGKGARLQPGQKNNRKRMATVASVYETEAYVRSVEDILTPQAEAPERPKPVRKRVWASVVDDAATVIAAAFDEALRRDPQQQQRWVVLIDGQAELVRQAERQAMQHGVTITIVQDFIHVVEYLWKAAHALHPEDQGQREKWIVARCRELLRGNAGFVASGLRRAATRAKLTQAQRQPVDTAADYIANSQSRMQYEQALQHGFPIATGVIEGACRYLVQDRMDLTGARWRLTSAEAVLKLRALKASYTLDDYLTFHFEQEQARNYTWFSANDEDYVLAA